MVIDSHEHIMFPTKEQLDKMDAAGVDKAILFCTPPHPEKASNLNELETEMSTLYKILAGANIDIGSYLYLEGGLIGIIGLL